MTEARIFDLYDDPMPSLNDLEGYAGETVSGLIQLACLVLNEGQDPGTATAAGHAGVAYAVTGLMRALPWHASRRQMYLPKDVMDRHGLDPETVFRGENTPELAAVLAEMRGHVRHHLSRVKQSANSVPEACDNAFLPLVLVEPYLKRLEQPGVDPLKQIVEISQLRRQWRLWRSVEARFCRDLRSTGRATQFVSVLVIQRQLSSDPRFACHAAKSVFARSVIARFLALAFSLPFRRLPVSSLFGASIGGNRPKLTFMG